jgi:hypothetical protein
MLVHVVSVSADLPVVPVGALAQELNTYAAGALLLRCCRFSFRCLTGGP